MSAYWPWPSASFCRSFVSVRLRKSEAPVPRTNTSPMCEMSNRPAAVRTAWCSSMMRVYCTGISQPPNSMSLPPNFWCAANSGVRFNIRFFVGGGWWVVGGRWPASALVESTTRHLHPATCLPPFLRFHLFFGHFQIRQHEMFGELDQLVRAAGVEDGVRQIVNVFLDPIGGDAAAAAGPRVLRVQSRAGDEKVEARVLQLQLVEFIVENDVVGGADAVKNRQLRFQFALRRLAHEGAERRHARTARDADQMFVRLVNRQEFSGGRNDEHFVARLCPIRNARAHLAVALHRGLEEPAVQRAGRERVGSFVAGSVRPVERDELAGLEIGIVTVGPLQPDRLGIRQFHCDLLDLHLGNLFGHKKAPQLRKNPVACKGCRLLTNDE